MKPCADFTFDSDADCYVVLMNDGTEVCRTRAPHTNKSFLTALGLSELINRGRAVLLKDGLHVEDEFSALLESMVDFSFPVTYHHTSIIPT